jgi:tetratricopeptide (TPR) repeat protein
MMAAPRIFISYRRSDSTPFTGRLFDHLINSFGKDHVFRDIHSITPGSEFLKVIKDGIRSCDVLIAVIGCHWLTAKGKDGKRRLDKRDDYVKAEIREALRGEKIVIPVLVDGAKMPRREELPRSITRLVSRNAIEFSEARFNYDVAELIKAIDPTAAPVFITIEEHKASLLQREQEIREQIKRENQSDRDRLAFGEKSLAVVMERQQDPELSLARAKTELSSAVRELDRLHRDVPSLDLDKAKQALTQGDTSSAEELLTRTVARGKEQAGEAAYQLGELARHRIDYHKAYEYFTEASRLQPRNPHYLSKTAEILYELGRYGEAMPLLEQSLAIREELYGTVHPNVAQCLNHLAGVHLALGDYVAAEPLYKNSLEIRKRFFGSEHPLIAESLNNLGQLYYHRDQYPEAEEHFQQALAIYEKTLGHQHVEVATVLNNLANLHHNQTHFTEAEPQYSEALAIDEKVLGPNHPGVATDLNNLGVLYFHQGDLVRPEPLYQRALEIRKNSLGSQHPDLAGSFYNLARLYDKRHMDAEAGPLYVRALEIFEKTLPSGHPDLARVQENALRHRRNSEQGRGRSTLPNGAA